MKSSTNLIHPSPNTAFVSIWEPCELNGQQFSQPVSTIKSAGLQPFEFPFITDPKVSNPERMADPAQTLSAESNIPLHAQETERIPLDNTSQGSNRAIDWSPQDLAFDVDDQFMFNQPGDVAAFKEKIKADVLEQAHEKATELHAQILRLANQKADILVKEAQITAAQITQRAYQEGVQAAQKETDELLAMTRKIVIEVQSWKESVLTQAEPVVITLVQNIAQKLFGEGLPLQPEVLQKAFQRSLEEAKSLGDLRIRAHPDDVAILGPSWAAQQISLTGQQIELVPNKDIQRGSCYIEGQFGSVDARVKTQLRLITETLGDVLIGDGAASDPFTPYNKTDEGLLG